ncbi:28S ribosomal protein S26, mitochondrial [Sarcophilus harrisii]|uniref:28S ribosomal protein S26, mitochondrial n=1 Tax=Sarcophilus harrisii TaxID=9305 RepID=UPI001301E14F|nr:28S ribosomal protein S26, mitochondrial [Sarcophilus harrisii]
MSLEHAQGQETNVRLAVPECLAVGAMLAAVGRLGRSVRPPAPAPSLPLLLPPARGRKSRHDPPAKSKIGRLRTPTPVDPVEMYIVTERYKSYRQIVRALRISRFQRQDFASCIFDKHTIQAFILTLDF